MLLEFSGSTFKFIGVEKAMKNKIYKRTISVVCCLVMIVTMLFPVVPVMAASNVSDWWDDFRTKWKEDVKYNQALVMGALASDINDDWWFKGALMGSILHTQA